MNCKKIKYRFGLVVILTSIIIFFILFSVPFLSVNLKTKLALTPVLLAVGEVLFWLGIVLIGKDVYLNLKTKLKSGQWPGKKTDLN